RRHPDRPSPRVLCACGRIADRHRHPRVEVGAADETHRGWNRPGLQVQRARSQDQAARARLCRQLPGGADAGEDQRLHERAQDAVAEVSAQPVEKAAQEVIAGDPRESARAWLWPLTVAVAIIFAMDTYLVATQPLLPFDVPVARQRPAADLIHILTPAPGYSYPSGHAVFFTWLSFMLAFSLAPHVRPRRRWMLWIAAAIVVFFACCARVWAGAHWPSDVAGGFLLGLGWSAFVVWLPERWLP